MLTTCSRLYLRGHEVLNYRLRSAMGGRLATLCRPVSIAFLLTERCNAHCVHCDIWKNRGREDTPTTDEWKRVLRDLHTWLGPVHVVFTGGEALLRPFTAELAAYASGLGLLVEALTNGYWPKTARLVQLARCRPWRITVSLDAAGPTHSLVRGRPDFWQRTSASLELLRRLRDEERLGFTLRLKTVVMQQNLDEVADVAHYAAEKGAEVFYQPIEQNYSTPADRTWFQHSDNWPKDAGKAVSRVRELIALKKAGFPIANSYAQLEVMVPYFQDPVALQHVVRAHGAHEQRMNCAALTTLQFQPNGDVRVCANMPAVGNIRNGRIREIWYSRPRFWERNCCLAPRPPEPEASQP